MSTRDIVINLVTRKKGDGLKDLEKDLDGVGKKSERTGGLLQGLTGRLSTLGDNVGKNLTGKLGAAGDAADNLGLGLGELDGITAAAGAGIAAFGAFVAGGVKKMQDLYDQTRNFNEVAGTSWEEGSRLIAVFDDLRVSSEEGASAMGKLTKTVGMSPEVLKEYGIEVVRAKDGTVDMVATLGNVATAFQKTTDPTKRAKMGTDLFGKSWQTMVPVLNQGGDSLRDLAAAVDESQVATAEGAAQQDKMHEATDNLNDAIAGLQRSLAKDVIPKLAEFATTATTVVNAISKVNDVVPVMDVLAASIPGIGPLTLFRDAMSKTGDEVKEVLTSTHDTAGRVMGAAADALKPFNAEAKTTEIRAKDAAKAFKDWQQETRDLLQAQEEMRDAQRELIDTGLALEQAQVAAADASFELSDKAHVAANAVRDYGEGSTEAAIAAEEHRRSVLDARSAIDGAADAAVAHAEKQAAANNQTLTAAEKTKVYRDELIRMQAGVSDPALYAALQAQIDYLAEVASRAQNAAEDLQGYNEAVNRAKGGEVNFVSRNANGVAVVRRASGGPLARQQLALVGEQGPELFAPSTAGTVINAGDTAQMLSGAGAAAAVVVHNTFNVYQQPGEDPQHLVERLVAYQRRNGPLPFAVTGTVAR